MPPKRSLKKRESRMYAAIDAMSPMGFPKQLVRTTVNNLLKVYGGSEGWVFIECDAYKVLIEAILGEGTQNQANASAQDDLMADNQGDCHHEASTSSCLNRTLLPCTNTETSAGALLTNQAVDTASASSQTGNNEVSIGAVNSLSATGDQLPVKPVVTSAASIRKPVNRLPIIKAVDAVSADCEPCNQLSILDWETANSSPINVPRPVKRCKIANYPPQTKAPQPEDRCYTANSPPSPLLLMTKAPPSVEGLGRQRRKPCYGWISDDDDEEEVEPIELPPASLSEALSMFVNVNDGVN